MLTFRHFIKKTVQTKLYKPGLFSTAILSHQIHIKQSYVSLGQGAAVLYWVLQPPIRTWKFGIVSTIKPTPSPYHKSIQN